MPGAQQLLMQQQICVPWVLEHGGHDEIASFSAQVLQEFDSLSGRDPLSCCSYFKPNQWHMLVSVKTFCGYIMVTARRIFITVHKCDRCTCIPRCYKMDKICILEGLRGRRHNKSNHSLVHQKQASFSELFALFLIDVNISVDRSIA